MCAACKPHKRDNDTLQVDPDFCVVARLESFITGYGLDEALKRADAYHRAGADAILCHSKKADDSDIQDFMAEWGNRCPVVIVPTKYWEVIRLPPPPVQLHIKVRMNDLEHAGFWQVPTDNFREMGVSSVIWANHNMRSAIQSMQSTTKSIFESEVRYLRPPGQLSWAGCRSDRVLCTVSEGRREWQSSSPCLGGLPPAEHCRA